MEAEENRRGVQRLRCLRGTNDVIGVCRRIKRYKKLVEPAHKRTSPINRTRNPSEYQLGHYQNIHGQSC
jgi:hypothetical protein